MQLLDRYLDAVRFWLPRSQKDDIIAELSEDLRSAIADEEGALGRTLTSDEIVPLLQRRGHPIRVAAAYLPQRSLIGPALYPLYLFVLKVVALCFFVPWVATWIVVLSSVPSTSAGYSGLVTKFFAVWSASWMGLFVAFGLVTIVFAVIDRVQTRSSLFQNWDPRNLPPAFTEIPRSTSAFEVAALVTFAIWWAAMMSSREFAFGESVRILLTPQWAYVFWGMLAITAYSILLSAANLTRPYWTSTRAMLRLISDAAGAAVFCACLRIGIFDSITVASVPSARTAEMVRQLNLWCARALPLAIAVGVCLVAWDAMRVFRLRRRGFDSFAAAATCVVVLVGPCGAASVSPLPNIDTRQTREETGAAVGTPLELLQRAGEQLAHVGAAGFRHERCQHGHRLGDEIRAQSEF